MNRYAGYKPSDIVGASQQLRDLVRELDSDELVQLADTFFDVVVERNKAVRIINDIRRSLAIAEMKCAKCGHMRGEHRSDHNQMYQWFDACKRCECNGWEHEWGDPHLNEVLTFIDLMTGKPTEES